MKLIEIGIYADQTGLFSESELNRDNWCEIYIPENILRKWYETNDLAKGTAEELRIPMEEATLERWVNEVSSGDDTDGLYDFCITNGYTPKLTYDGPSYVFYRDDCNYKYIVFEGTYNECREFARECDWKHDDYELEVQ